MAKHRRCVLGLRGRALILLSILSAYLSIQFSAKTVPSLTDPRNSNVAAAGEDVSNVGGGVFEASARTTASLVGSAQSWQTQQQQQDDVAMETTAVSDSQRAASATSNPVAVATNVEPADAASLRRRTPRKRPSTRELPRSWPEPQVLRDVAIDGTVVVFITTCPYIHFLENAIASMQNIGYTNYVIVPLDRLTLSRVTQLWPNHVVSVPDAAHNDAPFQRPAKFNTKEFRLITSSRAIVLKAFLSSTANLNILYCDVDTYWQSDRTIPRFQRIQQQHPASEMIAIVDAKTVRDGLICSGILYLPKLTTSSSPRILDFLSIWDAWILTNQFLSDQAALYKAYAQIVKAQQQEGNSSSFIHVLAKNNPHFPTGKVYFEVMTQEQRSDVCIVHNNWIRGAAAKRTRFREHGMWILPGRVYKLPNRAECGI